MNFCEVVALLVIGWSAFPSVDSNTRICTHCCDEIYPGNGTPVYYMTKGPEGDKGDIGKSGPQGERGIQGVQGSKGDKGDMGPMGLKGDRGEPAPINPESAFSVGRSTPMIGNETTAQALIFDKVFVNIGEQFHEKSGRFIAEHAGVYYFSYNVQSYLDKFVGIQLMRNQDPQVIIYANTVPRRIMQSQTVILHVCKGDVVWLRQVQGARFAIYGNSDMQITFSGFLLYPDHR